MFRKPCEKLTLSLQIRSAMIPTSALMGPVRVSPLMGSPLNSAAVIPAGTGNTAVSA